MLQSAHTFRQGVRFNGLEQMSYCPRFQDEVDEVLGVLLRRQGYSLVTAEEVDGCRLYYRRPSGMIRIFLSIRDGEVNCDVRDLPGNGEPKADEWTSIWMKVGYGAGMSDAELIALMPVAPLSNRQMLEEIGEMLTQLG
jgi:hypothetical protein